MVLNVTLNRITEHRSKQNRTEHISYGVRCNLKICIIFSDQYCSVEQNSSGRVTRDARSSRHTFVSCLLNNNPEAVRLLMHDSSASVLAFQLSVRINMCAGQMYAHFNDFTRAPAKECHSRCSCVAAVAQAAAACKSISKHICIMRNYTELSVWLLDGMMGCASRA